MHHRISVETNLSSARQNLGLDVQITYSIFTRQKNKSKIDDLTYKTDEQLKE